MRWMQIYEISRQKFRLLKIIRRYLTCHITSVDFSNKYWISTIILLKLPEFTVQLNNHRITCKLSLRSFLTKTTMQIRFSIYLHKHKYCLEWFCSFCEIMTFKKQQTRQSFVKQKLELKENLNFNLSYSFVFAHE